MPLATVTSKGQVTIPKEVRDSLPLKTGDKIEIVLTREREALIGPVTRSVDEVFGMLQRKGMLPVSTEKMDVAVRRKFRGTPS